MSICTAKVVTGFALFFALVAVILKSVALSVPHFVDVHLVDDPNNANDGNRLGGVGVFQSEFDSDLEGNIRTDIEGANVPILTLNLPTTEFPLLFPAQENFIADVLPVNQQLLDALVDEIAAAAVLQPFLDNVTNLELVDDNCEAFAQDANDAVTDFFAALQDLVIPGAVLFISDAFPIETAASTILAIRSTEGAAVEVTAGAALQVFGTADLVAGVQAGVTACSDTGIIISPDLVVNDGDNRQCLIALFVTANDQADEPSVLVSYIISLLQANVCPAGTTVTQCIGSFPNKFVSVDSNLLDTVEFVDSDAPSVCDTIYDCTNKITYLASLRDNVASLVPEPNGPLLEQGINIYLNLAVNFASVFDPANSTFANGFANWPAAGNPVIDNEQNRLQPYAPCDAIIPLAQGAPCTNLQEYLTVLPAVLTAAGNPLAPTVVLITDLYALFFESELTENLPLSFAPGTFSFGLIEAGFNADFESQDIVAETTAACDDDVEDLEKITQAQALAAASTAFEAVAVLLIIVGIILPVERLAILAGFASVAGILGGVFILAALFVVQSAPVYDGVGESGEEGGDPEIFFIQGYVPLLALIDAILFFLSGVLLIAATVMACKESGETAVANVDEVKADGPMEDKI